MGDEAGPSGVWDCACECRAGALPGGSGSAPWHPLRPWMDGDTAWLCVPTALAGLLDELRASGPGTVARTRRPVRRARALAGLADFAARPVHVHGL